MLKMHRSKVLETSSFFPTLLCIHLRWCRGLNLWLTSHSISDSIYVFAYRFTHIQVGGVSCQEIERVREVLWIHRAFFLFPVCSTGESFSTSCQNRTAATGQHYLSFWPNSAAPQGLPLYCCKCSIFPCCTKCQLRYVRRLCCSNMTFVNNREAGTSPLCCLPRWSAPRTWLSSERAVYAGVERGCWLLMCRCRASTSPFKGCNTLKLLKDKIAVVLRIRLENQ